MNGEGWTGRLVGSLHGREHQTKYLERGPSRHAESKFSYASFMELGVALLSFKKPITGSYPTPDGTSPHCPTLFPQILFNIFVHLKQGLPCSILFTHSIQNVVLIYTHQSVLHAYLIILDFIILMNNLFDKESRASDLEVHHLNATQNHNVIITNKNFENVATFKFLGTTSTNQNALLKKLRTH